VGVLLFGPYATAAGADCRHRQRRRYRENRKAICGGMFREQTAVGAAPSRSAYDWCTTAECMIVP